MYTQPIPDGIKDEAIEVLHKELQKSKAYSKVIENKIKSIQDEKHARKNHDRVQKALNRYSTQLIALDCYMNTIKSFPDDVDGLVSGSYGNYTVTAVDFMGRKWTKSIALTNQIIDDRDALKAECSRVISEYIVSNLHAEYIRIKQKQISAATEVEKYAVILKDVAAKADRGQAVVGDSKAVEMTTFPTGSQGCTHDTPKFLPNLSHVVPAPVVHVFTDNQFPGFLTRILSGR